jgi:hypothetical protein
MYDRINGVNGIVGSIGNFFTSGLGQSLLQIGTTVGTAWLVNEVGGSLNTGQQPPAAAPAPAPAGQPGTIVIQPPAAGNNQAITYTALALGGAALLYVLLKRK